MADEPQQKLRRLLVQSWMRRPFLLEEEAVALYQRSCAACELPFNAAELPTVVQQINQGLDQFNLMIHFVEHHTRPVSYYILYNSQADEPSQLATTLKPIEIQVFSKMIGLIAQAPGGQASSMDLLNEIPANKGITKRGFEDQVMSKLIDDGWLEKTTPGVYTLGLRTLTELRRYLDAQYADLPKCGSPSHAQPATRNSTAGAWKPLPHAAATRRVRRAARKSRCPATCIRPSPRGVRAVGANARGSRPRRRTTTTTTTTMKSTWTRTCRRRRAHRRVATRNARRCRSRPRHEQRAAADARRRRLRRPQSSRNRRIESMWSRMGVYDSA